MGYTHYWRLNEKANNVSAFVKATSEMAKVVRLNGNILAGPSGRGEPELEQDYVTFNGLSDRDEDYESFCFVGPVSGNGQEEDFAFCKTAHKPYDVIVVACLAIAADRLGPGIKVSSDGTSEDWAEGVALASRVLGREVPNPIAPVADAQEDARQ